MFYRNSPPPLKTFLVLTLGLLLACSNRGTQRGALTSDQRADYLVQYGAFLRMEIQTAFKAGHIAQGMPKELVQYMWGIPDRTSNEIFGVKWSAAADSGVPDANPRDSLWVYYTADSSQVRVGLWFQGDTLARWAPEESK